jgi:hypothetical protein
MRLEPRAARFDPPRIRRQYAGSVLEIDSAAVRYTGPEAKPELGWSVSCGQTPGQASGIVHVTGEFPVRFANYVMERYVLVDLTGKMLGSLPSGRGVRASAAPTDLSGWYPEESVREMAAAAGLRWRDEEFTDASQVLRRYPGLDPQLRVVVAAWWSQGVIYAAGGGLFAWLASTSHSDGADLAFRLAFGFLAVLSGVIGVLMLPPVTRRLKRRTPRPT